MRLRFQLLFRLYHFSAALRHWLFLRIRPAGWVALFVAGFSGFMCLGQQRDSMFLIFCFTSALLFLAFAYVIVRHARLSAAPELPRYATAGEPLRYRIHLQNLSRRDLRAFQVQTIAPDPRPTLREFASLSEPGEEERNRFDRVMAYYRWQWLLARKAMFESQEPSEILSLKAGQSCKVELEIKPLKRGAISVADVRVLLPEPLGFFQKCRRGEKGNASLIVLPKRYRLPDFEMPGAHAARLSGEESKMKIGSAGEFLGLRDYRSGDSLRRIHWKSWAHSGKPMIKELEDTQSPRYGLVLDTFPGSPDEMIFEEMVSVAASLVVGLDRENSLLDLMFIAGEAHSITAGQGMERVEKLLEVLASVKQEDEPHFDALRHSVRKHRGRMSSCILLLNGWDQMRADFVQALLRAELACVCLVIGEGTAPKNLIGHWIRKESIAQDLLRLPTRLSAHKSTQIYE